MSQLVCLTIHIIHGVEMNENENFGKYLDLTRKLSKVVEYDCRCNAIHSPDARNNLQVLRKESQGN